MTPRTMEFSDFILQQRLESFDSFDLRENAPIMQPIHPKMLKAMMEFMNNPERETVPVTMARHFACYGNTSEASKDFPKLTALSGMPFSMGNFLSTSPSKALFDFSPFGAVVLSADPLPSSGTAGIHQHTLRPFLEYALSPELWGTQGKWTRFHQRLNTQFEKFNLLNEAAVPGRYPLVSKARKLEQKGIRGTQMGSSYVLTLPWTFSLTALKELEQIIQEEF